MPAMLPGQEKLGRQVQQPARCAVVLPVPSLAGVGLAWQARGRADKLAWLVLLPG